MSDKQNYKISNKVLFVDDEPHVLNALKRLFWDSEFDVLTATSGKEGLKIVQENEIAVIVSDQRMPEMSGPEFLKESIKVSPYSVRVVLTGYADINAAMEAINDGGAYKYITKPWDDENLKLHVLNALGRYRVTMGLRYCNKMLEEELHNIKGISTPQNAPPKNEDQAA